MPIVKSAHADQLRTSAIVMDLSDVEHQAGAMVKQARAEAEAILQGAGAKAAAESTGIREEARRAGHDAGFKAGTDQGLAEGRAAALAKHAEAIQQLVTRWNQTLALFQENLPAHLADARTDLVRLAVAIAATVTRQEGLRNRAVVQANAEAALGLVTSGRHVAIRVHPTELATIEDYIPSLLAAFKNIAGIKVETDAAIEPGGCITRFGAGEVDARLETQIQRIATELLAKET